MNRETAEACPPLLYPPLTGDEWFWILLLRLIGRGRSPRANLDTVMTLRAALDRDAAAARKTGI